VLNYLGESKAKAAKIQIESFSSARSTSFYLGPRAFSPPTPTKASPPLTRSKQRAPGWNGPYLRGGVVPNDPWGHSYIYRFAGRGRAPYEIISLGSDGQEGGSGTAADIAQRYALRTVVARWVFALIEILCVPRYHRHAGPRSSCPRFPRSTTRAKLESYAVATRGATEVGPQCGVAAGRSR